MDVAEAAPAPIEQASAPVEVTPQPVTIVKEEPKTIEQTMSDVWDKDNPKRENGKFAAADKPAESAEAPATELSPEPVEAKVEPAKAIDPPVSWTAEAKALWEKVPLEAREYIAKRDAESHKRISELGEVAKSTEPLGRLVEPLKQMASRSGLSAEEGLRQLLVASDFLSRDPQGAIKQLAANYRVDLASLVQPNLQNGTPESEAIRPLMDKISYLERQLAETSHRVISREQQEFTSQQKSLESLVNDFAKGKDYWAEIESEVLGQISAIKALEPNLEPKEILEKAHERALKLNDAVSKRLNETKAKEDAAKKVADAKRKADEAKRQTSLNVKSTVGASAVKGGKLDMNAEMAEVYNRMNAA